MLSRLWMKFHHRNHRSFDFPISLPVGLLSVYHRLHPTPLPLHLAISSYLSPVGFPPIEDFISPLRDLGLVSGDRTDSPLNHLMVLPLRPFIIIYSNRSFPIFLDREMSQTTFKTSLPS